MKAEACLGGLALVPAFILRQISGWEVRSRDMDSGCPSSDSSAGAEAKVVSFGKFCGPVQLEVIMDPWLGWNSWGTAVILEFLQ